MRHSETGFTLIELMTAITVIFILSAIAIRQLSVYQVRAFDARAENDLRSAVVAEEGYYAENETYVACTDNACGQAFDSLIISDGIELSVTTDESGGSFTVQAHHPRGEKTFRFDSNTGHIEGLRT